MKMLMCGLALSLAALASTAMADPILNVDGEDYLLSTLLKNCQIGYEDPEAQIACVNAVSQLLEEQNGGGEENNATVGEALDALRAVAQYQDDESGLIITGSFCSVQILYFNNYFHISRRNISSLDLFSAQFNASKLQFDQTVAVQGAQAPLLKGMMEPGATAEMRGGVAMESMANNFEPRSPRTTMDVYATEVASQLPVIEDQDFDFVLIHPERSQEGAEIMGAFEAFVAACKQ